MANGPCLPVARIVQRMKTYGPLSACSSMSTRTSGSASISAPMQLA
jgi:hypothetical protein